MTRRQAGRAPIRHPRVGTLAGLHGGITIPDTGEREIATRHSDAARRGSDGDGGSLVSRDVTAGDVIPFGEYTSQEITLEVRRSSSRGRDEGLAVVETG